MLPQALEFEDSKTSAPSRGIMSMVFDIDEGSTCNDLNHQPYLVYIDDHSSYFLDSSVVATESSCELWFALSLSKLHLESVTD